jgi:hypothetical protein
VADVNSINIDHGRPQDWKKVQGVEAIAILINHKMVEIAKANAKRKGQVDPNNLKEQAGDGRLKKRVNLDSPDGQASNGRPKMRSTKVPTKRGHSFSVKIVNEDVSREKKISVASRDKVGSAGMDANLEDEAAGAALRTGPNGAAAWGRRLCRCCVLSETPRTYRDTPEVLPFFTGWCNKRQWCSVTQEADRRVAVPPSLNGLVRRLYARNPKYVKRPEGPRMMAQLLHQDRCQTVSSRDDFFVACRDEVGSAGTDVGSTTRRRDLPSGHA